MNIGVLSVARPNHHPKSQHIALHNTAALDCYLRFVAVAIRADCRVLVVVECSAVMSSLLLRLPPLLLAAATLCICVLLIEDASHEESVLEAETVTTVIRTILQLSRERNSKKRKIDSIDDEHHFDRERKREKTDYEAGFQRVRKHCIGSDDILPRFNDRQFERMFRVTRTIFQNLLNKLCAHDSFFVRKCDACKKPGMCPEVKTLAALKTISYGVTAHCFTDYFEMGETARCANANALRLDRFGLARETND